MIKKAFPFLSLILFSALAIPISFIVVWNLDGLSKTVAEHFDSALKLAIPSGLVLIAFIWFGAGLDFAISFIAKKSLRILASILIYLFMPTLCCFVLPSLAIMAFSGVFKDGWQAEAGLESAFLMTFAFIPAVMGFLFIYLGAGVNFTSRWLAGRIWPENQEHQA